MKDSAKYKNAIAKACLSISNSRAELFTDMVNVAMTGSYKEIDSEFEVGEIFHFSLNSDISFPYFYLNLLSLGAIQCCPAFLFLNLILITYVI